MGMNVLARKTLLQIGQDYPDALDELLRWEKACRKLDFTCFADVQAKLDPKASWVGPDYLIFNVRGGRYRLITTVDFQLKTVWLKYFLTHAEYDKWKPER